MNDLCGHPNTIHITMGLKAIKGKRLKNTNVMHPTPMEYGEGTPANWPVQ